MALMQQTGLFGKMPASHPKKYSRKVCFFSSGFTAKVNGDFLSTTVSQTLLTCVLVFPLEVRGHFSLVGDLSQSTFIEIESMS